MKGIDVRTISSVISLSFLIILLLVGCEKPSSKWMEYSRDNDGNVRSYKKVNTEKDIVQVWVKLVYSDVGRKKKFQDIRELGVSIEESNKLSYSHFLSEIDCKKQRISILSIIHYDTDGNSLYSHSDDKPEWEYIDPDSNGEIFLKKVCK